MTRLINYINKDFNLIKNNLILYTKQYFPNTYKDFNLYSPGMLFILLSSYVGTVLSYYTDYQFNLIYNTSLRSNILKKAIYYGYRPRISTPSYTSLNLYIVIPSTMPIGLLPVIKANMQVKSYNNTIFTVREPIFLNKANMFDKENYLITQIDSLNTMILYKNITAISAEIGLYDYTISLNSDIILILIPSDNLIQVLDVFDNDNQQWRYVDYFSQLYVTENSIILDLNDSYINTISYISTNRKFTYIVGLNEKPKILFKKFDNNSSIVPTSGKTLKIRYLYGGGLSTATPQNTITSLYNILLLNTKVLYDTIVLDIKKSIAITNLTPAVGGTGSETNLLILNNILKLRYTNSRCIELLDYKSIVKIYSKQYGNILKIFAKNSNISNTILLYVLGKSNLGKASYVNNSIKNNLKKMITQFKSATTNVQILNALVINMGCSISITSSGDSNHREVLLSCILKLYDMFSFTNRLINQPIYISDIYNLLYKIRGLSNIRNIQFTSKLVSGYNKVYYDFESATSQNIIYPTITPSIFVINNINDIEGS